MKQKLILETEVKQLFRKASEILRQTKLEQTYGTFSDGKGKFCAMGAIYAELGWDGKHMNSNWRSGDIDIINYQLGFNNIIQYGECTVTESYVIGGIMNDQERKPFSEIADYLEIRGL